MALRETLAILKSRFGMLVSLTLLLYGPYEALNAIVEGLKILPEQGVSAIFGLLGLFIGPVGNGAVIHIVHNARAGVNVSLADALKVGVRCWTRLVAVYIFVSFVMLAYVVLTVLPGGFLMLLLHIKTPFVLIPFGFVGLLLALPPYAFVDALVVVDGMQPWHARQASWALTKGQRWKIIGYGLAFYMPAVAIESIGEFLGDHALPVFFGETFVSSVGLGLLSALIYVFTTVLFYVLYASTKRQESAQ